MKIEEVPQERGMMPDDIYEVCYALDDDGHYVLTASAGWDAKNIANSQAWEVIKLEIEKALKEIHAGKRSPLAFHMAKNQMNTRLLAQYSGFSRWRVKRHLKPSVFKRLSPTVLERYSDVFGITPRQLQQFPEKNEPAKD
ncbi:MAG: helix-turn-helix transcriptional regulator [Thermodesulfobacteriota bacterium]|nr:helix-turn-helix transcriptional regulator [Thermodesulfobacteriota bacterium]